MFRSVKLGAVAALFVAAVSTEVWATNPGNNGNGNGGCGVGQQTNGCGGAGGAGGAGGTGVGVGVGVGISHNKNTNNNLNANHNSNRNVNRNTANGGAGGVGNGGNSNSNSNASSDQQQEVNNSGAGSNSNNYNAPAIPVSSAVAPSFAIGSCQWAFSGGLQLFGAGVSAGSAGMYEFCKALMKSKHMSEQGKGHVAKALECQDSSIRAAYKSVGDPCIEDMPRQVASNGATTVVPVLASKPAASPPLPANCTLVQPGNYITCQ